MNIVGRREEFHHPHDEHANELYSSGYNGNAGASDFPSSRFVAKVDSSGVRNANAGQPALRTRLDNASEKVHTKHAETESANGSAADSQKLKIYVPSPTNMQA